MLEGAECLEGSGREDACHDRAGAGTGSGQRAAGGQHGQAPALSGSQHIAGRTPATKDSLRKEWSVGMVNGMW